MSHDQITIGPSDDSGPPNGVPNDGYRRNDQFPDDCQGVQICHAWDMNRDGGPGPQDGGPWNGDPGIWAQGPRDGRFNGDPGIWAEGPRDGRWNRDPGIWSDMPPGGPGQRFDGGSTDTAAVMKAASAVSQAYDYSGDPTLNTGGDPSATNNGTVGDGTYNPTYEGDAGTGDGTTVTDATTSDTSTATSPFQAVVALGQQVREAGQMTPELKQQFEAAIQQADSGQSPRLAGLQAEFSQKDQELNAALTQDVVTQISDINNQLMTGISQLPDQNQQAQGQALLSMLDSAVSAEDKAQIRGQLLQLLPNAGSLLDQRDQVTAPFQDKLFAISSLGQEIAAEQNQAVYTRVIYAQALAASGDATSASGIIDEALSKNTDQTMVGYLQQVKQSLSGTAAPTGDTTSGTVTDNTNVGPGSPDTGTPPDTGSVTVPDTGSVTPPDTGTGLGDTSGQNSDNPYDLGS
ncbi:MAG: hypothetical protein U0105_14720 [Candidatus Obscuribacterales bacterium]